MSNFGANNCYRSAVGVGMWHALAKGLYALLVMCVFFFYPQGLHEVCFCVFEVLGRVFFSSSASGYC